MKKDMPFLLKKYGARVGATDDFQADILEVFETLKRKQMKVNTRKKDQIYDEALEVYAALKQVAEMSGHDYCLSWWINTRNFPKTTMSTPTINRRAMLLVKKGYLTIDNSQTSTSTGTCFKFTNLKP